MSEPKQSEPDPAAVWWGPQQPQQQQQQQRSHQPAPFQSFAQHQQANEWRWHYSKWTGVMYGPIPVGLIVAIPILILLWS